MELKYNVTGSERKRLVVAMAEYLGCSAKYLGAPTFAYEVDCFTIDKNGTVSFDDSAGSDDVETLVEALSEKGFAAEDTAGICIELPRVGIPDRALETLRQIVDSKATLIKKALGADRLDIEVTDDTIRFPWFASTPKPEVVSAAAHLIGKLVGTAQIQKRVTAKEVETDNEKYTFRTWLLRLGFIGDEYKGIRKTLLRNLSGNGAYAKSGEPSAQDLVGRIEAVAAIFDDIMSLKDGET